MQKRGKQHRQKEEEKTPDTSPERPSSPQTASEEALQLKIIQELSKGLESEVKAQDSDQSKPRKTAFSSETPPTIKLLAVLQRVHKWVECSKECYVLGLIYIKKLL